MKKRSIFIIGSGALVISMLFAGISLAEAEKDRITNGTIQITTQPEADFPSIAKVSLEQAIQKAVMSNSGQIITAELKEEDGFLVYCIEVVSPDKTIMEVVLDAGSGKVLSLRQDKNDHADSEENDHEHDERDEHDD